MGEGNVETIRGWLESINEHWRSGEPLDEQRGRIFEPDVDYYPVRKWPESKPCHGIDELAAFMDEYWASWKDAHFEPLEISAVGDDRVLAHARLSGAGHQSGVHLEGDIYVCFWMRHGRVFRLEDHLTEAGARRALGLGAA